MDAIKAHVMPWNVEPTTITLSVSRLDDLVSDPEMDGWMDEGRRVFFVVLMGLLFTILTDGDLQRRKPSQVDRQADRQADRQDRRSRRAAAPAGHGGRACPQRAELAVECRKASVFLKVR